MGGNRRAPSGSMKVRTAIAGALTAGAALFLAGAPLAFADPQDGSQQCPDQQGADGPSPDQQCQSQGDPAKTVIDNVQDGVNQAQQQLQQPDQDWKKKPISQVGAMYMVDGAPRCIHNWDVLVNDGNTFPVLPFQGC
jgi:hypothetical protein